MKNKEAKKLACSDLHGQYDLWRQIKEYLNPEDELYFLGDAIDRGPDGFKIMQEILDRPNTIYIRGNHEQMMIDALEEQIKSNGNFRFYDSATELWFYNGGKSTFNYIENNNISKEEIIKQIKEKTVKFYLLNCQNNCFYLTHAGSNIDTFYKFLKEENNDALKYYYENKTFIWDRNHINPLIKWRGKNNEYIIYGHTPVGYIDSKNKGNHIDVTAGGHKICLDLGAHIWGRACLFNLDTIEVEKYFSKIDK